MKSPVLKPISTTFGKLSLLIVSLLTFVGFFSVEELTAKKNELATKAGLPLSDVESLIQTLTGTKAVSKETLVQNGIVAYNLIVFEYVKLPFVGFVTLPFISKVKWILTGASATIMNPLYTFINENAKIAVLKYSFIESFNVGKISVTDFMEFISQVQKSQTLLINQKASALILKNKEHWSKVLEMTVEEIVDSAEVLGKIDYNPASSASIKTNELVTRLALAGYTPAMIVSEEIDMTSVFSTPTKQTVTEKETATA